MVPMHENVGWLMMWPMWPLGAGLAVVLVWVLVNIVRSLGATPPPQAPSESAEDIVKRRYAKGELDHDTFEHMLADLKAHPA